jgi:hypothetical protein
MKLGKSLLIVGLFFAVPLVWAKLEKQECDRDLVAETLGEKLKIALKDKAQFSHYEWQEVTLACKSKPDNNKQIVVATFYESLLPRKSSDFDTYMFALAIVDKTKRQVISLHTEKHEADATTRIGEYSLKIDTAAYYVANGVRAIGVRMSTFFGRCTYEGGWDDELWLFTEKKPLLKPVLKNYIMQRYSYQTFEGNLCGGSTGLIGVHHKATLSLTLGNQFSHSYRDLIVHAALSSESENFAFKAKDTRMIVDRLKFNSTEYQSTTGSATQQLFEQREEQYRKQYEMKNRRKPVKRS